MCANQNSYNTEIEMLNDPRLSTSGKELLQLSFVHGNDRAILSVENED